MLNLVVVKSAIFFSALVFRIEVQCVLVHNNLLGVILHCFCIIHYIKIIIS